MATKDITDAMIVAAYAEAKREPRVFADSILERTGHPPKVIWRAMERACSRGLVGYGVSLRSGWLTDAGTALLKATTNG